jgi:hypothetical protein
LESLSELLLLPEICVQFLSVQVIQSAKGSVQIDAEQFHCRTFAWSQPNYAQQSMQELCNFTFKQASQLLNCKYVQKPFGNVSSDLSMLQMGHWSHVQLVWNGLNVCQEKWQICQGFNTNFMVLYFGVRKEKYHRVIIIIHWTRANSGIYHPLQWADKELLWRGVNTRQQMDNYSEAAACHCPSSTNWLLHLKPWVAPLNFASGWQNRCQLVHQPNIFSCTKNLLHIKHSTSCKHSETFRETWQLVKMLNQVSTEHHLQLSSATTSYSQMTTHGAWDSSLKNICSAKQ